MATNRLLDTRTATFGDLIGNGRRYKVPSFQRDYAWHKENWEDLWQDILIAHRTTEPHFMGAVVTSVTDVSVPSAVAVKDVDRINDLIRFNDLLSSQIAIIDGQQRLSTLSILAIAIIQQIQKLVEKDIDPSANRDRAEILRRTYIGDKDPSSLRYSSKLSLNENDDGFYQNNLVNLRAPRNVYILTQSERLLWQAFEYFSQQLASQSDLSENGAFLSDLLTKTIAQRLVFIEISIEHPNNAYVLFETLNSRGVELGSTDLLKNYVFSLLKGPDDHKSASYKWKEVVRIVGMEEFPEFLKSFLSMQYPNVRKTRLFKLLKEKIQTAEQAFDLLDQLSDYSSLYVALGNANDDFWRGYNSSKSIREKIRQLNLFEVPQVRSVLLAAANNFDEGRFEKLLKMLTALTFRYVVVSQLSLNELERQCNTLAVAIAGGKVKSPKAAFDSVAASLYVKDEKFKQDFALFSISNQRKKGLLKYILRQLEQSASSKDVPEESFSVEHILPQSPDENWLQSFTKSTASSFVYRLGNVTPLEPNINSALGRADYTTKQSAYVKSAYTITQAIQSEEWTVNSITSRQDEMADQAVHIWRIDYSAN